MLRTENMFLMMSGGSPMLELCGTLELETIDPKQSTYLRIGW